jgi:hypothetical protein
MCTRVERASTYIYNADVHSRNLVMLDWSFFGGSRLLLLAIFASIALQSSVHNRSIAWYCLRKGCWLVYENDISILMTLPF